MIMKNIQIIQYKLLYDRVYYIFYDMNEKHYPDFFNIFYGTKQIVDSSLHPVYVNISRSIVEAERNET